jgi:hypothetical protein
MYIVLILAFSDSAPQTPIFLQARDSPPLASGIKPAVKVLARRPPPKASIAKDDEDDSEEEERKRAATDFAERQARAAKEREEKQRKYNEVRERLFGTSNASGGSSSAKEGDEKKKSDSSPGSSSSGLGGRDRSGSRNPARGGRGGKARGGALVDGANSPRRKESASPAKQLFEPTYSAKPGSIFVQRREAGEDTTARSEDRPIRTPKGPDGSGRGGFGFAPRGGASSARGASGSTT